MSGAEALSEWFERDIRLHPWIGVRGVEPLADGSGIRFRTAAFTYDIHAEEASEAGPSYLGCTFVVTGRKLAGDLPDGELNEGTWKSIVLAILENEIEHMRRGGRTR